MTLRIEGPGFRPTPPQVRDPDGAFDLQVRIALVNRARVEGKPPEAHGYEVAQEVRPGDSLNRIGLRDDVAPPVIEAANQQFPDPNLIHPGQAVFVPGRSPVSGATEGLIDQALRFDRENPGRPAESDANWQSVQQAIAGELRQSTAGAPDPEAAARDTVDKISLWTVGTDRLGVAAEGAFDQVMTERAQPPLPEIDTVIDGVERDLDTLQETLDDHGIVRSAWGWIQEHTGGERSEFEEFLETTVDDLKEIEERQDNGELTELEYASELQAVMGDYGSEFEHYSQEQLESDQRWDTAAEVGRVAASAVVGVGTTILTGGNVVAGAAAGALTYEAIDATQDISAVLDGEDIHADGHSSLTGLLIDGVRGEASWEEARGTLLESGGEIFSSALNAGSARVAMATSRAVTSRLAGGATQTAAAPAATAAAPTLFQRGVATASGAVAAQTLQGGGQVAMTAGQLQLDGNLFTAEGGQAMTDALKREGVYLAAAPLSGFTAGMLPLNRMGLALQPLNDTAVNIGGAELQAQWVEGRHMNGSEVIAATIGGASGGVMNLAGHAGLSDRPGQDFQAALPDIRLGFQVRARGNTNLATDLIPGNGASRSDAASGAEEGGRQFQIGHPTLASAGVAIGTKSDIGAVFAALRPSASGAAETSAGSRVRQAAGEQFVLSMRPSEYNNITLAQLGLLPTSNQTAFQFKGSDLLEVGRQALFTETGGSPFAVMPRTARIVGQAADGSGTVVELSYGLSLMDGQRLSALPPGEREFFGAPADNGSGFIRLPGDLTYSKLMEEFKASPRPRLLAGLVPVVDRLVPRVAFERRPELSFPATLSEGTIVSREFFNTNQIMLGRTDLRVQFVVGEQAAAARIVSDPRVSDIRNLVQTGRIDPSAVASYVPGVRSGLRLSAVPGKPASAIFTDLTGQSSRVWDSRQSNLDITFNDYYPVGGRSLPNPDRSVPARVSAGVPHAIPSDGNIYRRFLDFDGAPTRYTVSLATPPLRPGVPGVPKLQSPLSLSLEVRFQYKRDAQQTIPVDRLNWTRRDVAGGDGFLSGAVVPTWLNEAIGWSQRGLPVIVPKGGKGSVELLLSDLEAKATPVQRTAIEAFRRDVLPAVKDRTFLPPATADRAATFLDGMERPHDTLPPPDFIHLADPAVREPLQHWYEGQQAESPQRRQNPLPLWNDERGRAG